MPLRALFALFLASTAAHALTPDLTDVAYGPHERNKLDLYQTKAANGPAPVVVFIHGGGFRNGDKSKWAKDKELTALVNSGVTCATINYPFLTSAPVQDILKHCARSVQFLRSKAGEWNLDKTRFAAIGGSAGPGTSLSPPPRHALADPNRSHPVLPHPTRPPLRGCQHPQPPHTRTTSASALRPASRG